MNLHVQTLRLNPARRAPFQSMAFGRLELHVESAIGALWLVGLFVGLLVFIFLETRCGSLLLGGRLACFGMAAPRLTAEQQAELGEVAP